MTVIGDFTTDEQRLLLSSLEASAIVVSVASPGRTSETVSEGFAVASYILDSLRDHASNPLVTSAILAIQGRAEREESFPDYVELASRPRAGEMAEGILRAASALLDAKASPDEARGYKQWLLAIAEVAAAAGKEDQRFLGTGGVVVNDREREAIERVAALLAIPHPLDDPSAGR